MKLLRLHVENFGTLQNFDLELTDGLNILYQKNGWGKSTLAVFIKAMFYGLPATSRRSLDENERKKYTPWQGGVFGGSLEFSCEAGTFRIERFFGAKEAADSFSLYDLSTNKPSAAFSANVGEEIFGIDADGFERTTYLSQRTLSTAKENNSISAKLGNLLDDVGDIGCFDVAMESLDKRRKFYVMTGNRGAIADMEQERAEKQAELERCQRVREAMLAQEEELDALGVEIKAMQKAIDEARERLKKAGHARERAALLEQKNKMLDELAEWSRQKKKTDEFFRGLPPSREELAEARRLYEDIREASVRLDTIPKQLPDQDMLTRLKSVYPSTVTLHTPERMEQDNRVLQELRMRYDTLTSAENADEATLRFPDGVPSKQRLDEAFTRLDQAKKLQKTLESLENAPDPVRENRLLFPMTVAALCLGVLLTVLSFLPILAAGALPLLIGGIVLLLTGGILSVVRFGQVKARRQRAEALRSKCQELKARHEGYLQEVRELVTSYRMSPNDLSRSLTELSLLAAQYHEGQKKRRRIAEECQGLQARQQDLSHRLRSGLKPFVGELPLRTDYRAEIDRVRREITLRDRLEIEEQNRKQARDTAEDGLQQLKAQLLPFLRRYDPNGSHRAGDCLDRIGAQLIERDRLVRLIATKEAELKSFIAEKRLDDSTELPDVHEFEALGKQEAELAQELEAAQRRHTLLKSGIERLALDADRVPELEETLAQIKEALDTARANAKTIADTAKLLEEAKTALSTRYLGGMQESFTKFLSSLTPESTPEALMDTSFEVRLREGGQTRTMESFSRGWRDAVQFCVRLSLTDALYRETEQPFLLLDDPFVNLDDERLCAARSLLEELSKSYQILYLVCHKERV